MTDAPRYNRIGDGYDTTRQADPYLAERMAELLGLRAGSRCLDLACGTGNYSTELSSGGSEWWGIDASGLMLEKASAKTNRVNWLRGDAAGLPFGDETFDAVLCTHAIHHFDALEAPFGEAARTLRGGPLVILTSTSEQTSRYWLRHYFPDAISLSAKQLYPFDKIESALRRSGFVTVAIEIYNVREDLQDKFLYSAKHRPAAYLDQKFRAGISTFREWTEEEELKRGLRRLREDIETGEIRNVVKRHENDVGDYMFVIAK